MNGKDNNSTVSDVQVARNGCGVDPLQQGCVDLSSRNLGDRPNVPQETNADPYGPIRFIC